MNQAFKPEGYNSASPYFIVNGAEKFITFLKDLFNASELRKYSLPDGRIMHAEVKIDDSVIMIGDASEKYPAIQVVMHVYVPNVDEVYEKAIKIGCEGIETPTTREGDPDKRGTFKDYAGNLWSVGTQL